LYKSIKKYIEQNVNVNGVFISILKYNNYLYSQKNRNHCNKNLGKTKKNQHFVVENNQIIIFTLIIKVIFNIACI